MYFDVEGEVLMVEASLNFTTRESVKITFRGR